MSPVSGPEAAPDRISTTHTQNCYEGTYINTTMHKVPEQMLKLQTKGTFTWQRYVLLHIFWKSTQSPDQNTDKKRRNKW